MVYSQPSLEKQKISLESLIKQNLRPKASLIKAFVSTKREEEKEKNVKASKSQEQEENKEKSSNKAKSKEIT